MKIVEELSNSIENLDTLIKLSKEGKKIGIKYSEDILVCGTDFILEKGTLKGLAKEDDLVLKEGLYIEKGELFVKEGTLVVYEEICDDKCGVLGDIIVGHVNGVPYIGQCLVAEDECSLALIGTNVYIVE